MDVAGALAAPLFAQYLARHRPPTNQIVLSEGLVHSFISQIEDMFAPICTPNMTRRSSPEKPAVGSVVCSTIERMRRNLFSRKYLLVNRFVELIGIIDRATYL
jgi:hypothetical protein